MPVEATWTSMETKPDPVAPDSAAVPTDVVAPDWPGATGADAAEPGEMTPSVPLGRVVTGAARGTAGEGHGDRRHARAARPIEPRARIRRL
jgi:hypothetical protein